MKQAKTISCVRTIHFCYGHRLVNHPGKCANLHGHNAALEIHARRISKTLSDSSEQLFGKDGLDKDGMVVDFGILKSKIGGWIDQHWDHNMILSKDDIQTIEHISKCPGNKEVFILPYNPTAENLARYLLEVVCPRELQGEAVEIYRVTFNETPNCYAEAALKI